MKIIPAKKQFRKWSFPTRMSVIFGGITFSSLILTIFFFIDQNIYGAKINLQEEAINERESNQKELKGDFGLLKEGQNKTQKQIASNQEELLEILKGLKKDKIFLKNCKVEGTPYFFRKFPIGKEINFDNGTLFFQLNKTAFFNNERNLVIAKSLDNKKSLNLYLDENNFIHASHISPEMGGIVRTYKVNESDFENKMKSITVGFTWNLYEKRTTLYINGEPVIH